MIKVLLVDDQPLIRQGLRYILDTQADIQVIGEATTGADALQLTGSVSPDVVLMDIQMPNTNGIEATQLIHLSYPEVKVILLTTFDVQEYVYDGIRAGAVGYLLKDSDTEVLLDGIRCAYAGQAVYRTQSASQAMKRVIDSKPSEPNAIPFNPLDPLTDRELDVLQLMAYGLRNSDIASKLMVSEGTVKTHVHRILQKLSVEDRTQAVVLAIRQGIVK